MPVGRKKRAFVSPFNREKGGENVTPRPLPQQQQQQDESSGNWEYLKQRKEERSWQRSDTVKPPAQGGWFDGRDVIPAAEGAWYNGQDVAPTAVGGWSDGRRQGVGAPPQGKGLPQEGVAPGGLSERARRRIGGNAAGDEVKSRSGW